MGVYLVLTLFVFLVHGVVGDASELNPISAKEGHPFLLNTGVTKQQRDKMLWYFNDILIAQINGEASTSCLYDGEGGRFRDRLVVDYETGSLNITNIRPEHAGRYEANFIQSSSSGTSQSLNRNSKCDSTKITRKISNIGETIKTFIVSVSTTQSQINNKLDETGEGNESDTSSGLFAGVEAGIIVVGVLLLTVAGAVTAGVIMYLRHRRSRNEVEKNKLEHLLKV